VRLGTLAEALRPWAKASLDVVYPPRCVGCGRFGAGFFCEVCLAAGVAPLGAGFCANCSAPWDGRDFCPDCAHWDALDGARAAFTHEGAARRAVHALKYGHVRAVAASMAAPVAVVAAGLAPDAAFAIPLHKSRERRRGYNQAAQVLERTGLPTREGRLLRSRRTHSQIGLALAERRANVGGAFDYEGQGLEGARVVLIDDVITTGATANECARVLKDHGARTVWAVAFTRASSLSRDA
jgi:ComF family protein